MSCREFSPPFLACLDPSQSVVVAGFGMKATPYHFLDRFVNHLSDSNSQELDLAVELESEGIVCVEQIPHRTVRHPFVSSIHEMFSQPTEVDDDVLAEPIPDANNPGGGGEESNEEEEEEEEENFADGVSNSAHITENDKDGASSLRPKFGSLEIKTIEVDESTPIRRVIAYGQVTHWSKVIVGAEYVTFPLPF